MLLSGRAVSPAELAALHKKQRAAVRQVPGQLAARQKNQFVFRNLEDITELQPMPDLMPGFFLAVPQRHPQIRVKRQNLAFLLRIFD